MGPSPSEEAEEASCGCQLGASVPNRAEQSRAVPKPPSARTPGSVSVEASKLQLRRQFAEIRRPAQSRSSVQPEQLHSCCSEYIFLENCKKGN